MFIRTCRWIHKVLLQVVPSRVIIWVSGNKGERKNYFSLDTFLSFVAVFILRIQIKECYLGEKNEYHKLVVLAQLFNLQVFVLGVTNCLEV